jgi:tRNA dimethylallyltransferase
LVIGLERALLKERIANRVVQMLEAGWLEEVDRLMAEYGWDLPLLATLGYEELVQHRRGALSLDAAISLISQNTQRYAKRQLTWFRGEKSALWIQGEETFEQAVQLIESFLAQRD